MQKGGVRSKSCPTGESGQFRLGTGETSVWRRHDQAIQRDLASELSHERERAEAFPSCHAVATKGLERLVEEALYVAQKGVIYKGGAPWQLDFTREQRTKRLSRN